MLDRYEFWHAAAAVLLVLLMRREPRLASALGWPGFALLITGALLPLGDYLGAALAAPDSIGFLLRTRWLHSLVTGPLTLAAGALVAAFVVGSRRAVAGVAFLAAGWVVHLGLDAVTPAGIWLGPPGASAPFDWPAFAKGHSLLIALLLVALGAPRLRPDWHTPLRLGAWALIALYFGGGMIQYAVVSARAAGLAAAAEAWDVAPVDPWRASWQVVLTGAATHRVGKLGPLGVVRAEPSPVPRGNDEPLLLGLLGDPVVRRFYFQVFRHPVTQVDETPVQITLTIREAGDVDGGASGATFSYETDRDGRERVYHVERFD